jgi:hypothetical protein
MYQINYKENVTYLVLLTLKALFHQFSMVITFIFTVLFPLFIAAPIL